MELSDLYNAVQEHGGYRPASRATGIPESTIRRRLKDYSPDVPDYAFVPGAHHFPSTHIGEEGVETEDFASSHKSGVRRYILTSAQNNVPVHKQFLQNLEALAERVDAQILISYTLYDRTGYRGLVRKGETRQKQDVWWDKATEPYAFNQRGRLAERLAFCGELDILATTKNPLASLESYCGRSSIIVPHNRFALKCVPSRKQHMPKEMHTTGSVTTRKFIQRKAGQVAHFHHVLGAVLVEVDDDGYFFVHHLNAEDDGSFFWLDREVRDGVVRKILAGVGALILGDVHHEKLDQGVADLTIESIVPTLNPEYLVVHDLIDFTSRNHHNRKDPFAGVKHRQSGIHEELYAATEFLERLGASCQDVFVVPSNHDHAFLRWIRETDWRDDPVNADLYLDTAQAMVNKVKHGTPPEELNPLQWWMQEHVGLVPDVTFLGLDEGLEIEGIECGMHGHIGPNGSRGNPRSYSKMGFKTFTAHTHTPSIVDGCYTVGVMGKLDMGYNVGPSSWMHAHGIIYPNGKRAFVWIKNGKWRA